MEVWAALGRLALDRKRDNTVRIVNFRRYIPDHAVTTVPALALMIAVHFFLLRDDPSQPGIEATSAAPGYYQHWQRPAEQTEFDIDAEMARLELDDSARDHRIRALLHRRDYAPARTLLLEVAASAVFAELLAYVYAFAVVATYVVLAARMAASLVFVASLT